MHLIDFEQVFEATKLKVSLLKIDLSFDGFGNPAIFRRSWSPCNAYLELATCCLQ
jgi:hypothetical protein